VSKEASVASKKEVPASLKHPSMWKTVKEGSSPSRRRAGWVEEAPVSTVGADFSLPRSVGYPPSGRPEVPSLERACPGLRSGKRSLPSQGQAGWVDGKRYQRLMLLPFYPSCSPLSRGETWGLSLCSVWCAGVIVRRYGEAQGPSLEGARPGLRSGKRSLSSQGQAGWVDEALVPTVGANFFLPRSLDNLPPVGPKSPPWRGRDRVGRWAMVSTVNAAPFLPLLFSPF
jgi:hypothetical protein